MPRCLESKEGLLVDVPPEALSLLLGPRLLGLYKELPSGHLWVRGVKKMRGPDCI